MTHEKSIYIKGARVHNLKNIEVEIPHDKLVVVTGLSGSGKSTLAFDTIFAEGVLIFLRASVLRPDGKTGCGEHRGTFPGDIH